MMDLERITVSGEGPASKTPRTFIESHPIWAGGGLGIITLLIFLFLSDRQLQECSAILLAGIAGAYWGFAAIDGRFSAKILEGVVGTGFCIVALMGLWGYPLLIGTGYIAHGLWDILHHRNGHHALIPLWWIPFCVVYDWTIGIFLFVRWW